MPSLPITSVTKALLRRRASWLEGAAALDGAVDAALDWIERAAAVVDGRGISKGYDLLRQRWAPAYPETTGYSIPTLLNAERVRHRPEIGLLARCVAHYLLQGATADGAVRHWQAGPAGRPVVFDTGQAIFGWLAAFDATSEQRYLQAAAQAGEWLCSIQDKSGAWLQFQHLDVVKVIDTRVAWVLLELNRRSPDESYVKAAIGILQWAQKQQDADGWFQHCAFSPQENPFTHTLAYAAEGLYECGRLLEEPSMVASARRTADALLERQRADGSLASTYGAGWRPTSRSSCLTGNCQMARLWLRFYETNHDPRYLSAAERAIHYTASTQVLDQSDPNIYGGIAGSYPIGGRYERLKYPNWAAKFLIDAILTLEKVQTQGTSRLEYVG